MNNKSRVARRALGLAVGYCFCLAAGAFSVVGSAQARVEHMAVVEIGERLYEGAPALSVVLSDKLAADARYDGFLEVRRDGAKLKGSWVLGDNRQVLYFPHVEPDSAYAVRVRQGLTAANGRALPADAESEVATKPMRPSAGFAADGMVLPDRLTAGLPVRTVNVAEVDVEFLRVKDDKLPVVARELAGQSSINSYRLDRLHPYLESVYMARFDTHGEPNTRTITNLPVEELEQLDRPGLYVAVLQSAGRFERSRQIATFFISDIGLHVRDYGDAVEVHAASLHTGAPMADVRISVRDKAGEVLVEGETDEQGRINLRPTQGEPEAVVAAAGGHVSFVHLRRSALDLSDFDVTGRRYRHLEAFIYTPRDLYRPGESVAFSALLRDADGRAVADLPLQARLVRADGRELTRFTWRSQQPGFYSHTFDIPSDAPTGEWRLEVRSEAKADPLNSFSFKVEEFLPERMKLLLESDQAALRPEEPLRIDVLGEYLYGAPAAGNRFTAAVNLRRHRHPVETLEGFYFGDPDDEMDSSRRDITDVELDEAGRTRVGFEPLSGPVTSPMRVLVVGNVYETGGRPVTRTLSRTVWPAQRLVGIRPLFEDDRADYNTDARFEVVRVNTDGARVAADGLEVTLIRESRDYYWEYDEGRGWHRAYSQTNYPVHRQNLSLDAGEVGALSLPVEWGRYSLRVRDPDTGLTSRYRFYAGWSYYRDRNDTGSGARPDKVTLALNKPAYGGGDTARVQITPPHAGEALIMVEGDRPLWRVQRHIPEEGATVEIPVRPEWRRHDLYVTAMVLRPADAEERIAPKRALGVVPLKLDRADRQLDVGIDAPEKARPEQTLTIGVDVDAAPGETATVTVAAVDVGVLNITGYESPDPHGYFFAQRRYGVDPYDLYSQVIEGKAGQRATLAYGGDAPGLQRSQQADAEVKIVSLFSGAVRVNDQGRALVKLPVPDFNGRLRLMAVAFTAERFGAAEQEVLIRAPLVAELATPRFLGSGDHSLATLDLHNLSERTQDLQVDVTAEGPLELTGGQREVTLSDEQRTTLRFPIEAALDLGVARIRVAIEGQDLKLVRTWELGVRPAYHGVFRAQREAVEPGETLRVASGLAANLMPNTVAGTLQVSPQPPLNLDDAFTHLLGYPYGCAEQTTSKAFPLLFADAEQVERFGIKPLSLDERRQRVEQGLTRLAGMQNGRGGFGLWRADGREYLWLTAYVAHFLVDAERQGFVVPETMREKALKRLRELLVDSSSFSVRVNEAAPYRFAARAYAGYVLALVERAPLGELRTLYRHEADQAVGGLALVQLGVALTLSGDRQVGEQAIDDGLDTVRENNVYVGDYGTPLRDTAAMLYLLHRHDVASSKRGDLLFRLADQVRGRRHFSTQERNMLFLAGLQLSNNERREARLDIGSASEDLSGRGAERMALTLDQLDNRPRLTNRGEAPLFVSVEVAGYPHAPMTAEEEPDWMRSERYSWWRGDTYVDAGRIDRQLLTLQGDPVGDRKLEVGELLLVHIRVDVAEDLPDGLLVDLIPAGLEIENQNLEHAVKLGELRIDGVDVAQILENRNIRHQEYRDDRFVAAVEFPRWRHTDLLYLVRVVTPGVYTWSAPSVEDMYRPEIRASGDGDRQVIVGDALD